MESRGGEPTGGFHLEALQALAYALHRCVCENASGIRPLWVSSSLARPPGAVTVDVTSVRLRLHARRVPPHQPLHVWVEGYQYPLGGRYRWHDGYWTRPPYAGAYWVAPYYRGGRYYAGRWEGDRGHIGHDHHWDRDKERDEHRDHHKDRDHDRR